MNMQSYSEIYGHARCILQFFNYNPFFQEVFFPNRFGIFSVQGKFPATPKMVSVFFPFSVFFPLFKKRWWAFFRVIFRSFFRWPFFCRPFYFRAFFMIRGRGGNKSIKIFSSQSSNILNRLMGLKLNNKNDDIISKD